MTEISVNLATHNRAAFLEKCLESLCAQTLAPSRYEICVIASACTDNTPEVVARIAARHPQIRIFTVAEPMPGLSRARNVGLAATKSPIVAHIDDDGTVNPEWLQITVDRFNELGPDVAVVGGEIDPVWGAPRPDWMTEKMQWFMSAGSGHGTQPRFLTHDECASEGNSSHRRAALVQAGGFPETLGRSGSNLLSGEQVVESTIRKNGGKVFYDPNIVLHHFIHADRLRPIWLRRRLFWQGVSSVAIRQYQIKHAIPVTGEIFINLPLKKEDWDFIAQDTPADLEQSMLYFHSLGLALALSGLLPIDGSVVPSQPPAPLTPILARRHAFWQGVRGDTGAQTDLPLQREDWMFLNDANRPADEGALARMRALGATLRRGGFISIEDR